MKLYVQTDINSGDVLNISTIQNNACLTAVQLIGSNFNFDKMKGYKIEYTDRGVYQLSFDKAKYDAYIETIKKEQALQEAKELRHALVEEKVLSTADDAEAYVMRYLYDEWKPETEYKVHDRRLFGDNLYKCKQAHTSQAEHTPDLVPALWDAINDDPTKGTLDNPIPIPEPFTSMIYKKGCYYIENEKLYLMNRTGMERSDEIALTYRPSELVGQYFEVVK